MLFFIYAKHVPAFFSACSVFLPDINVVCSITCLKITSIKKIFLTPSNHLFPQHALFQSPELKIPVSEFFTRSLTLQIFSEHLLSARHCSGCRGCGRAQGSPSVCSHRMQLAGDAAAGQRPRHKLVHYGWDGVLREKSRN